MKLKMKRTIALKKAIKEIDTEIKLARQGKIRLEGHRPITALQMTKEVYEMELARAKKGLKPAYAWQWYSELD